MEDLEKIPNAKRVLKDDIGDLPADPSLEALLTEDKRTIGYLVQKGAIPKKVPFFHRTQLPGEGHFKRASAPHCE